MKIRLNTLLVGTSLVLMGSTIRPAMADVDMPVTTIADVAKAENAASPEPTQPAQLGVASAEDRDYAPMTRSERFRHYLTSTFGLGALNKPVVGAEIMHLRNVPREWGGNSDGFAPRLGSELAQHIIRGTMQYGASEALHEDNRYMRSGKTGFWKRTGYAVSSTFLARRPDGRRRFSFSRFGSAGGAAFIARTWMPPSIATAGAGASSFGLTIAFDVGSNMFREFWPDIKRNFRGR